MATAKNSAPKKITTTSAWKASVTQDVELPSGHVVRARRVGMEVLVTEGLIPNALMPIVNKALSEGKRPDPKDLEALTKDLDNDKILEMMSMYDNILVYVVLEPSVTPFPVEDENGKVPPRDPQAIYPDEVTLEDKVFIYQWSVGGSASLEKFREEQETTVESIQPSKRVASKAKPATRNRK